MTAMRRWATVTFRREWSEEIPVFVASNANEGTAERLRGEAAGLALENHPERHGIEIVDIEWMSGPDDGPVTVAVDTPPDDAWVTARGHRWAMGVGCGLLVRGDAPPLPWRSARRSSCSGNGTATGRSRVQRDERATPRFPTCPTSRLSSG